MAGDLNFVVRNGLIVNTNFAANGTQFGFGANVFITPSRLTIQSVVSNVYINATAIQIGDPTANLVITSNTITIINPVSNLSLNASSLFIGNSLVSSTLNALAATIFSVNTNATYVWANAHTFNNNATFNSNTTLAGNTTFTGTVNIAANMLAQTLTDGATINWNMALGQIATVTLAGNRTIAPPTNLKVGTYILFLLQDATGTRTVTWNTIFRWTQNVPPVLSTGSNVRDMISFVSDGTYLFGTFVPGFV